MPWVYEQATGRLRLNTVFVGTGYSGHGAGLNDPAAQNQPNVGPIPLGSYSIGPVHTPPDHLGPDALPLLPDASNQMFGRFGFFIHGDNENLDHTASNGCIILAHDIRSQIAAGSDKTLSVVSGLAVATAATTGAAAAAALAAGAMPGTADTAALTAAIVASGLVNAYPELPVLPYQQTAVAMDVVVRAFNDAAGPLEVKRASYVIFRTESGDGQKGINNDYVGAQADSGRWPEALANDFSGVVLKPENGTLRTRLFLGFKSIDGNLSFLMQRIEGRGLYIGGMTHDFLTMTINTADDLARAYHKEWVTGSAVSEPGVAEKEAFVSMYRQAVSLIT